MHNDVSKWALQKISNITVIQTAIWHFKTIYQIICLIKRVLKWVWLVKQTDRSRFTPHLKGEWVAPDPAHNQSPRYFYFSLKCHLGLNGLISFFLHDMVAKINRKWHVFIWYKINIKSKYWFQSLGYTRDICSNIRSQSRGTCEHSAACVFTEHLLSLMHSVMSHSDMRLWPVAARSTCNAWKDLNVTFLMVQLKYFIVISITPLILFHYGIFSSLKRVQFKWRGHHIK